MRRARIVAEQTPNFKVNLVLCVPLTSEAGTVEDWPVGEARAQVLADACSKTERKALAAEREAVALYQSAWASKRVGQEFDGRVAFVADFGLFVHLQPSGVEGLVHVRRLAGDRFELDGRQLALVGLRTKRSYRVGAAVRVKVESVNLSARQVDLALIHEGDHSRRRR